MSKEPLTLTELQTAKDTLETKARQFREALHELRRTRPDGWQAEFATRQAELVKVVSAVGRLDKRIYALVEGE
jgi:hypothetical protein